jgi:dTMP kinase
MTLRGKFIAIEGIDGSGKGTQAELLAREFATRGMPCARFSFPRYDSSFGRLVGRFLNGEFGALSAVDAHFSALLYAGDRFEAKGALEAELAAGKVILADRYVASNLAHQTARVPDEGRPQFMAWLRQLEYGIYGLPREDLVIYLRLNPEQAYRLVGTKSPRPYTGLARDLQEADRGHLEQAAKVYEVLATESNWATIECADPETGSPKTPAEIHQAVMAAVGSRVLRPLLSASASSLQLP